MTKISGYTKTATTNPIKDADLMDMSNENTGSFDFSKKITVAELATFLGVPTGTQYHVAYFTATDVIGSDNDFMFDGESVAINTTVSSSDRLAVTSGGVLFDRAIYGLCNNANFAGLTAGVEGNHNSTNAAGLTVGVIGRVIGGTVTSDFLGTAEYVGVWGSAGTNTAGKNSTGVLAQGNPGSVAADGYCIVMENGSTNGTPNSYAMGIHFESSATPNQNLGKVIRAQTAFSKPGDVIKMGAGGVFNFADEDTLRSITATDTFAATDKTINCSSGTYTVNLPTAAGIQGKKFVLKNSGAGTITLDGDGSETIDGTITKAVTTTNAVTVQSDGANWIII